MLLLLLLLLLLMVWLAGTLAGSCQSAFLTHKRFPVAVNILEAKLSMRTNAVGFSRAIGTNFERETRCFVCELLTEIFLQRGRRGAPSCISMEKFDSICNFTTRTISTALS